jgi:hypothetical protein
MTGTPAAKKGRAPACGAGRTLMSIAPLLADSSFDPELIKTLAEAWRKIVQSGSKFASPRYERVAQEIIAKRIIDMAQRGELAPHQLADDAVNYLAQSYA